MRARVRILLVLVCLATALTNAQQRGAIVITAVDNGFVVPGAAVTLRGIAHRTCVANERGECRFDGLAPGTYEVEVSLPGFVTSVQRVTLADGQILNVRAALVVASLQETIMVTGTTGEINVSASSTRAAELWERRRRNTESYKDAGENPFLAVSTDPLSTFSIDVDTASYANMRRFLNDGELPPAEAIRIEELVNYFRYAYPQPKGDQPFSITTELADAPWNRSHRLALIGLQGRTIDEAGVPPRNLVFLIDVSGSMNEPDKLPLVRHGLRMLANTMRASDRVAIVVYAGESGLVLPSTSGDRKALIDQAIAGLEAGGSTNGGEGIELAYRIARENFIAGGVNRVILATDGDFNVGIVDEEGLTRLIERERASGVFLSVLGVGKGNLKDSTMEMLADKGNGNYSYLDSMHEAQRVLVKEAGSTLVTIAKDVKIQVEFNPRAVQSYRLIGYENRMLQAEDFNDDRKDAGEIGAGHSVTAIYEIVPAGTASEPHPLVDELRYADPTAPAARWTAASRFDSELLTVKLRYKAPDSDKSELTSVVMANRVRPIGGNLGFASSVAEAAMLLRGSRYAGNGSFASVLERARTFRGADEDGYRAEFIRLMDVAAALPPRDRTAR